MELSFNALAPTFMFILVGYVCKRLGVIKEEEQPRMNMVGFRVFLPIMLFNEIYSTSLASLTDFSVLGFIVIALLCVYLLTIAFVLRFEKTHNRRGVMIQAIFRSNFVLLGLPIASALYPESVGITSIAIAVIVPIFNVLAVIALEVFNGNRVNVKHVLLDIVKNPLIISSLLGMLMLFTHIRLPYFVEKACGSFSKIATPYLLFLLGVFFRFDFHFDRSLVACLVGRLVVVPAVVLTVAALLGFRDGAFAICIGMFCSPTATSSFTMALQTNGDARLAGNSVVLGCVCSFFTIFGWMCLFMALGIL